MPDGSIRMVQGKKDSGQWITGVAHGKYMDMVPVGNLNGSSSTYYTDMYWISTATVRVVYRGASLAFPEWRCFDVACELRFLEYEPGHRFSSGLPRQNRPGAKRGSVQGDTRGGVSAKRQSVERSD